MNLKSASSWGHSGFVPVSKSSTDANDPPQNTGPRCATLSLGSAGEKASFEVATCSCIFFWIALVI